AGITATDYRLALEATYRQWDFRLQYAESDWQFLSRVLERDGVYYYFLPGSEHEEIVFCDSRLQQAAMPEPEVRYMAALGMDPGDFGETVHSIVCHQRRMPRTVVIHNYNDERPSIRISAE